MKHKLMVSFVLVDESGNGKLESHEICSVLERVMRMNLRAANPDKKVRWLSLEERNQCKELAAKIIEAADTDGVCFTLSLYVDDIF